MASNPYVNKVEYGNQTLIDLTNDTATADDIMLGKTAHDRSGAVVTGTVTTQFIPVGTVISVMGKVAPTNYLICDGSIYNITEYQALANYFEAQFESKNYFGGDGITTFAVPDLRGEFLRGTGSNSHINTVTGLTEGDGSEVGVHQDATNHLSFCVTSNRNAIYIGAPSSPTPHLSAFDRDRTGNNVSYRASANASASTTATSNDLFTSRPTNTSVLYCIATKDIYTTVQLDTHEMNPTPSANLTEDDVVQAINGALPSNAQVASLFGIQQWSNVKEYIVPYNGTVETGATGIGEWQDSLDDPTAQDEAGWGWWYDDMFKIPNLGTADNVEVKLLYDPALSGGVPVVDGGYQLDTDTGYLCIKFGKAVTVNTNKLFVKLIITRNNYS